MAAMSADEQICPDCSASYTIEDNYCRKCGMFVAALRQMTTADAHPANRAIVAARPGLPAPVKKAATAVAIGTALQIGVSVAGKLLANQAARSLSSALRSRSPTVCRSPLRQPITTLGTR